MLAWLKSLWDRWRHGKPPDDSRRSTHWPPARAAHLRQEPACQWCGRLDHAEVHHIQGFEEHPELELDPANMITLCRPPGGLELSCHFNQGHREPGKKPNWKRYNHNIRQECIARQAVQARGVLP